MTKRARALSIIVLVTIAVGLTVAGLRSRLHLVGQLSRDDIKSIRSLLSKNSGSGLQTLLRKPGADALANWIMDWRAGKIVRFEVQNTNRVLVFLTTGDPSRGRMLVIDRLASGWRISETNDSVTFR